MRVIVFAAATAAAILGLSRVPTQAADMAPVPAGPPVADYYDEPEEVVPVAPAPLVVAPPLPVVTSTTYVFGGSRYCWFEGGWNGAGWYVCDYGPWVRGSWWGGPAGWNNWVWRGGPRVYGRPYQGPHYGYGPGPVRPPHYGPGPARPPHYGPGPGRPHYGGGPGPGAGRPVYAREGGYHHGPRGGGDGRWRD